MLMYQDMLAGMYIVRTRELSWARQLSGTIMYVQGVQDGNLIIQLTEDCVPTGKRFSVDGRGNDGNWHDATDLVLEANAVITPPFGSVAYNSPVAANYRNFLGLRNIQPLIGEDAQEQICVLGEESENGLVFSKTGYFVVAHDKGWYIAYQGFCDYVPEGSTPQTILRVLMLSPKRNFYPAKPVIDACTAALNEDMAAANKYTATIKQTTDERAHEAEELAYDTVGVARMNLGV